MKLYVKYENESGENLLKTIHDMLDMYRVMNKEVDGIVVRFSGIKDALVTGEMDCDDLSKIDITVENCNLKYRYPVVSLPSFITFVTAKDCEIRFNTNRKINVLNIKSDAKYMNVGFSGRLSINPPKSFRKISVFGYNKNELNIVSVFGVSMGFFSLYASSASSHLSNKYIASANYCIPITEEINFSRNDKKIYDLFKAMLLVCDTETWYNKLKSASKHERIKVVFNGANESIWIGEFDFKPLWNRLIKCGEFVEALYKAFDYYDRGKRKE